MDGHKKNLPLLLATIECESFLSFKYMFCVHTYVWQQLNLVSIIICMYAGIRFLLILFYTIHIVV